MHAPSPYASIMLAAASHARAVPSIDTGPRLDPANDPSDASQRARNARLAASVVASIAFRSITAQRGDYAAIRGCYHSERGAFSTKR